MGRPVNKKFFGDYAGAGDQIRVSAYVTGSGGNSNNCWIIRQMSTNTFYVSNGTQTGVCTLQAAVPSAEGQMRLTVTTNVGGTEYAKLVNGHQVKTFSGTTWYWTPEDVASATRGAENADLNLS